MRLHLAPTFKPGTLSREDADSLNRAMRDLYQLAGGITADAPLTIREGVGGVSIGLDVSAISQIAGSGSLSAIHVYTAGATWTNPGNLAFVEVECIGGGGGGGGAKGGVGPAAGGGGRGGTWSRVKTGAASLTATVTVTVGAAGTAGSNAPGNGGNGGSSSFGAFAVGAGGNGGLASNGAATTVNLATGGNGDVGGNVGDLTVVGSDGGTGVSFGATNFQWPGEGGGCMYAGRRVGSLTVGGAGTSGLAGSLYGGGGTGGVDPTGGTGNMGAQGQAGLVIVREYV